MKSHGFFDSKGICRLVPQIYHQYLKSFLSKSKSNLFYLDSNSGSNLSESSRQETNNVQNCVHSKGFWAKGSDFYVTIVGSSNYNYRGYFRDFEFQLMIVSKFNTPLSLAIENDFLRLKGMSTPICSSKLRPPSYFVRSLLSVVKKFF